MLLLERAAAGTAWAKGFCDLPLASVLLAGLQGWTRSWVVQSSCSATGSC